MLSVTQKGNQLSYCSITLRNLLFSYHFGYTSEHPWLHSRSYKANFGVGIIFGLTWSRKKRESGSANENETRPRCTWSEIATRHGSRKCRPLSQLVCETRLVAISLSDLDSCFYEISSPEISRERIFSIFSRFLWSTIAEMLYAYKTDAWLQALWKFMLVARATQRDLVLAYQNLVSRGLDGIRSLE